MMLEAEGELRTHSHNICASTEAGQERGREREKDKSKCSTHANALQLRKFACQLSLPTLLDNIS